MRGPGARIADRYRVEAELGAGGMGVVYRARDEKLGREVALKTVSAGQLGDERARARLIREARVLAGLSHPGIVQVFDVGETDDGGAFLVMELVDGRTLRALMRDGPLPMPRVLAIARAVAEALAAAHGAGVVHRDVKPDNVMVRRDGRVVVLDFGLVKRDAESSASTDAALTRSGAVVGTPAYLAPEQARGRASPASDQFSLAVMIFELLAGRTPWVGETSAHVLAQILLDAPPSLHELRPDLPASVDGVLARALAKSEGERHPGVTDLVDALESAFARASEDLASAPTLALGSGAVEAIDTPALQRPRRRRWAVALVAVALVAGGGVASFSATRGETAPSAGAGAQRAPAFGCPVWSVRGDPSERWLGAAAADAACLRLSLVLDVPRARARGPAHLLDLPRVPTGDFPPDVYDGEEARARSLEVARATGDPYVDGEIGRDGARFVARLAIRRGADQLSTAEATGPTIYAAIEDALDRAVHAARIEAVPQDADPARCDPAPRPDARRAYAALMAGETGVGLAEACAEMARDPGAWSIEVRRAMRLACLDVGVELLGAGASLTVAELGTEALAREQAQLEEALEAEAPSAPCRARRLARLAAVTSSRGDSEAALTHAYAALELDPYESGARSTAMRAFVGRAGFESHLDAAVAWEPSSPDAWRSYGWLDDERGTHALRRAMILAPQNGQIALWLAERAAGEGDVATVRALAARFATTRWREVTGECLAALADAAEQRPGAAYDRMARAIDHYEPWGTLLGGVDCVGAWMGIAALLDRERDATDHVLRRFVLSDPHRIVRGESYYLVGLVHILPLASPEVGLAAMERLAALRASGEIGGHVHPSTPDFLRAAEAWLRGDAETAARLFRPLIGGRYAVPSEPFDRVGEPELASRADERFLRLDSVIHGTSAATAREALRAADRGDVEAARRHASDFIRVWETADVEVPAVARMRALRARLGVH